MLTLYDLVVGLGLPALVGAAMFLLARLSLLAPRAAVNRPVEQTSSPPPGNIGRDASPFALVLGYVTAETLLLGRPAIPPAEATQWLYFALAAMAVLSAANEFFARGGWRYSMPASIVAVIVPTIWLLVAPLAVNHWSPVETATWVAALTTLAAALTFALDRLYRRRPGPAASMSIVLVVALAAMVLLLSGTKSYAQLAAAVAAALAPGAVLAALGWASPFSRNIVPSFVLMLGGLLLAGHQYASLTALNALLLVFAPLGFWLPELPWTSRWPAWQRGLLGLAAVALPAGVATALAARKFMIDAASGY